MQVRDVSYLSVLGKHTRSDLRIFLHKLVDGIGRDIWPRIGKVHESFKAGIRLPQHSVAVSRNDASRLEHTPEEVVDVLLCELGANRLLHVQNETEHFLSSEAVKWASETLQTSAVAEEGIAKRRSDQVCSVGGDITALVVTVQSEIQSEKVLEALVLFARLA